MLFNSIEFIFFFLPLTVLGYWAINTKSHRIAELFLLAASLLFYGWWNPIYLPLLLGSALVNFFIGKQLSLRASPALLGGGIGFNVLLLGYFKYADFFIDNINVISGSDIPLSNIILPLAISFFTFQQISYLVDCKKGLVTEKQFSTYLLFVTFFPQLIAGPIVHHKEMMPQFAAMKNHSASFNNISKGLFIFSLGLFKKIMIADEFAITATAGFTQADSLSFAEAWLTSLSYTFQLYFDFSAYCDMAIGVALLFNIKLPQNFNSPYKALSIQDFWRRWHITLGAFLRDYIYIPLGGKRNGLPKTLSNLIITFLIGGIWHGAGWTFVVWGALHGFALAIHRLWQMLNITLPAIVSWFITFHFINICWVYFRAESINDAHHILSAMLPSSLSLVNTADRFPTLQHISSTEITYLITALLVCVFAKNTNQLSATFTPSKNNLMIAFTATIIALININKVSEFIYFNF
jgi:D-alanyl-lipoteichoic acid acyltransferase DltB (MBOAT superfamily)